MGKTHLNSFSCFIATVVLFFITSTTRAQQVNTKSVPITSYLQGLEKQFDIKFSYADGDLEDITITDSLAETLTEAIEHITAQTLLQIKELSPRYYSLIWPSTLSVCAFVLDNYEQNTIPGAAIYIVGQAQPVYTEDDGSFYLENVPSNALLEITHLGFKPLFIQAKNLAHRPCRAVAMAQVYQELNEVVVYKFLTTGLSKLKDGRIELLTDKFGILPGLIEPDVLQTVQALPGVKSVDETVSDLNIRGGTNDQNLLLWDGIKMYQSGHFFGLISAFNPYLTERVTLTKNGTSAQYGEGVSGTIAMNTKNALKEKVFGGAGLNLINGDVFAQIPLSQKLGLQFSGRRSLTDFLNTPTYTTFSDKAFQDSDVETDNTFYFYDFTAKFLYDINPDHNLRISLINMNNTLDYIEVSEMDNQTSQSNLDQGNLSFGGTWNSTWGADFSTTISTYYTQYKLNALTATNGLQQLFQNNNVLETSAKLHTAYRVLPQLTWSNGYMFTETGIENVTKVSQPFFESTVRGVLRSHAVYTELDYLSNNGLLLARIGARLNHYENLDTFKELVLEPRLNMSYTLARNVKTELLGEFKSQTTNQVIDLEQNFLGVEKRRWVLANGSDLPVTKSKQASLGVNYDKNDFYVGVEGFYKEVTGITVNTQGFQNQNQFNGETGSYAAHGVEFLANKKNNRYSAWFSYTYTQNNYTFTTLIPQNFPNNLDIRHAMSLAGNYNYNNFKLGIGLNYRSGKPFTQPLEGDPVNRDVVPNLINFSSPNSTRLPDYFRADASAMYHFEMGKGIKGTVGLSVLNFTNRKNILNTFYRLNQNNDIETVQRLSLGATPNASFRVRF